MTIKFNEYSIQMHWHNGRNNGSKCECEHIHWTTMSHELLYCFYRYGIPSRAHSLSLPLFWWASCIFGRIKQNKSIVFVELRRVESRRVFNNARILSILSDRFLFVVAFNGHEHGHFLSMVRTGIVRHRRCCCAPFRFLFPLYYSSVERYTPLLFVMCSSLCLCVMWVHLNVCVFRKTRQFLIRFST